MNYASIGLHLTPKGLILTPGEGEMHPEFQMMFYPNNIIVKTEAISRALTIMRRNPMLSQLVTFAQITFTKNDKTITKMATLHNLEVFAWFNTVLIARNPFDYLFRFVLFVLGGAIVVNIIKNHYSEDYDVDPSNSAKQIKKILGWAPPALRILTRLTALEDKLEAIGTERHRTGKRVAKRFEEQFPSTKPKAPVEAPVKPSGGGQSGSGMLDMKDGLKEMEKRTKAAGKL